MDFPSEVSVGETIGELCAPSQNKKYPDSLIVNFTSQKFKPFLFITNPSSQSPTYTGYMKNADGNYVHIYSGLRKD